MEDSLYELHVPAFPIDHYGGFSVYELQVPAFPIDLYGGFSVWTTSPIISHFEKKKYKFEKK